jgi:hypothetical protein
MIQYICTEDELLILNKYPLLKDIFILDKYENDLGIGKSFKLFNEVYFLSCHQSKYFLDFN